MQGLDAKPVVSVFAQSGRIPPSSCSLVFLHRLPSTGFPASIGKIV
jgi:hypothetical protein